MVGEDGFAAGGGEGVDGAEGGEVGGAGGGVVGEEEDAAGAGPELAEGVFGLEDVGASGQKLPYQRPLTRPLMRWTCWPV